MHTVAKLTKTLTALKERAPAGFALAMHIEFTTPAYVFQTFSAKWADRYSEAGFMLQDPVVHWGIRSVGTTRWSDLAPTSHPIMAEAAEHGLVYGCGCATNTGGLQSFAGFARADREFTDTEITEIAEEFETLHTQLLEARTGSETTPEELRFFALKYSEKERV